MNLKSCEIEDENGYPMYQWLEGELNKLQELAAQTSFELEMITKNLTMTRNRLETILNQEENLKKTISYLKTVEDGDFDDLGRGK